MTIAAPLVVADHDRLLDARWSPADPSVLLVLRSALVADQNPLYAPVADLLARPHTVELDVDITDPWLMFGRGRLTFMRFLRLPGSL